MKTTIATLRGEVPHCVEQPLHLLRQERGGRLVEDEHARLADQHLDDLEDLAVGQPELRDDIARSDVRKPVVGEDLPCRRAESAHADPRRADPRLDPVEEVLGDGQVGNQAQLLKDRADSEAGGLGRGSRLQPLAAERDLTRVRAERRPRGS